MNIAIRESDPRICTVWPPSNMRVLANMFQKLSLGPLQKCITTQIACSMKLERRHQNDIEIKTIDIDATTMINCLVRVIILPNAPIVPDHGGQSYRHTKHRYLFNRRFRITFHSRNPPASTWTNLPRSRLGIVGEQ